MFKLIFTSLFLFSCGAFGYFTLPGKCPENVQLQDQFRLNDFFDKWYQTYHYSSDGQQLNNCSILELKNVPDAGIFLNQSRIDRGLFHRYSMGKFVPTNIEDGAKLEVRFRFDNQPRRLRSRTYPFHILATNYNFFATVYTCQYSPMIDKHYIYVWLLSRYPNLNLVSKELAIRPLSRIGVDPANLVKDDLSSCTAKYYEDEKVEPKTFRTPVFIEH